jgi:hypothetical protein
LSCFVYIKNGNQISKGARFANKKYQKSTQSKYVVESSNSTIIEPSSINTVQEVVKKTVKIKKPKSKQLFPFYVNIEKCTNRLIGK